MPKTLSTKASPTTTTKKELFSDLPTYTFASAKDFEEFLEREHTTAPGFYLKMAKKASGIPSINAADAVVVALCFGWIDGRGNGIDETWWQVRYTPRRAKSMWSQKNVNTVARLVKEGRMRPAGLAAVEAAKADGRWDRAYAGPATITVPDDFAAAIAANPAASAIFGGLTKSERYSVLWRVQTASPNTRAKRVNALVEMLAEGKVPGTRADSASTKKPKVEKMKKEKKEGKAKKPAKTTTPKTTIETTDTEVKAEITDTELKAETTETEVKTEKRVTRSATKKEGLKKANS